MPVMEDKFMEEYVVEVIEEEETEEINDYTLENVWDRNEFDFDWIDIKLRTNAVQRELVN